MCFKMIQCRKMEMILKKRYTTYRKVDILYIAEPLAAPSNVHILEGTVTDTEADMAWDQVDLAPESIQGFFRGYRVSNFLS